MKIKPAMLWFRRTKQELLLWFQSVVSLVVKFLFVFLLKLFEVWSTLRTVTALNLGTWSHCMCVLALFISWGRILLPCSPWLPNIIFSKKLKAKWPCHAGLLRSQQDRGGGRDYLGWDLNLPKWQQVMCSCSCWKRQQGPSWCEPILTKWFLAQGPNTCSPVWSLVCLTGQLDVYQCLYKLSALRWARIS